MAMRWDILNLIKKKSMSFESSTALQIDALLLWVRPAPHLQINSIGGDAEQIEDLASGETVADLLG